MSALPATAQRRLVTGLRPALAVAVLAAFPVGHQAADFRYVGIRSGRAVRESAPAAAGWRPGGGMTARFPARDCDRPGGRPPVQDLPRPSSSPAAVFGAYARVAPPALANAICGGCDSRERGNRRIHAGAGAGQQPNPAPTSARAGLQRVSAAPSIPLGARKPGLPQASGAGLLPAVLAWKFHIPWKLSLI